MAEAGRRWPGRVAARAGRVPVLLAEEEGDREEEVGWAGQLRWAARWLECQVSGWASLFYFFVLFYFYLIFCHCFEFKIIQTMPKDPLNIFILLDGLFQKLIKYFRGI